jgi:hypothetical protein
MKGSEVVNLQASFFILQIPSKEAVFYFELIFDGRCQMH